MPIKLEQPCPKCEQPIGKHTVEEWLTHTNVNQSEVPFHDLELEEMQMVKLDYGNEKLLMVDSVDCYSLVAMQTPLGPLGIVRMQWKIGNPLGPDRIVSDVSYMSSPDGLRKAGKLVANSFNRSANKLEEMMPVDGQSRRR